MIKIKWLFTNKNKKMAKEGVYDWYKGLTPKWRGVMLFTATAVLVGGVYVAAKAIKKRKTEQESLAEQKVALDDAKELEELGMVATYRESDYKNLANQIFAAMDGYGTDVDSIYRVMYQINNDLDLKYLTIAFGVREISSGKWNPTPNYSGGLAGAMVDELSVMEISAVNKLLQDNGVTIFF